MTEMKEESWWKDTEWVPIANKPFSFFEGGEKKKKRKENFFTTDCAHEYGSSMFISAWLSLVEIRYA